jgi:hypothetical protein
MRSSVAAVIASVIGVFTASVVPCGRHPTAPPDALRAEAIVLPVTALYINII